MAPPGPVTISPAVARPGTSSGSTPQGRAAPKADAAKTDLHLRVRYNNTLPDIPFDPKFLAYPFDSNRFVAYKSTSLEKNYKFELLSEADLGVHVDLVTPDFYSVEPNAMLESADERLIEEDAPVSKADDRRSRQHSKVVPWLRKTEYISSEFNRYGTASERHETKVGYQIKKKFKEDPLYKDRESQLAAITKTFEDVREPATKHHSKPNVFAVQELPVLPDFERWKYGCAHVIFDSDPAVVPGRATPALSEEMSQALIRGMTDESGEQFVAYFMPTEETIGKRKRDAELGVEFDPDDLYEYQMTREYNWTVKTNQSEGYEHSYCFVVRDEAAFYDQLETKVRLNRRRKEGSYRVGSSKLLVKHRELTEDEVLKQEDRMNVFQFGGAEVEEEDETAGEAVKVEDEPTSTFAAATEETAEKDVERTAAASPGSSSGSISADSEDASDASD